MAGQVGAPVAPMIRWTGEEDLPPGETLLLEASAGTGKTWQIEALVVRLVAEYEVTIDRILVITFTNAATAELRGRIRRRLARARDALDGADEPNTDSIEKYLWADEDERGKRCARMKAALSSFDQAPISTIHGFSQRMLDQLAFESRQEPGLELLADPAPIIEQMVDDELARLYAEANEDELAVLTDMGWSRKALMDLAKAMTKAVAPIVEPSYPGIEPRTDEPIAAARAWLGRKEELRSWLDSEDGRASVAALLGELERTKGNRLKGMRKDVATTRVSTIREWLAGKALRSGRSIDSPRKTAFKNLTLTNLAACWQGADDELATFDAYPLFEKVDTLVKDQDRLWPRALASFASRVRRHVDTQLVESGRLTYSTMLSRLAERIDQDHGGPLAEAIRSRFDVALVDEFQDTDGAQWPVMQAVFAHPLRRLLLIGDPKQAIYSFRGADVHVYLGAAQVAETRATMRTNWRSDGAYVNAMNHLWHEGSKAFSLENIDYVEVGAAPGKASARIQHLPKQDGRDRRPFELRWVNGDTAGTGGQLISSKEVGRDLTAELAAQEAARLLEGGTEIFVEREGATEPTWSRLRPGDIAVLVRTNDQAQRVRSHLDRLSIPSVSAGRGSVMDSPAHGWLCLWLDAVAAPGRDRPARALATTPLFGWSSSDLAKTVAAAEGVDIVEAATSKSPAHAQWAAFLEKIRAWADAWPRGGFVRVFEEALNEYQSMERVLGGLQGERYATDLRHLIELCHAQERRTRVGPSGLASWLRASRAAAGDGSDEAEALRLESDARAVQLVTIHKSKGLEYPVVLLPFGWADRHPKEEEKPSDAGRPIAWHATSGNGGTRIHLNLEMPGAGNRDLAVEKRALEERQEQQRLLYVALTRARHHCVAWLGPIGKAGADTSTHALGRIALRERNDDGEPLPGGTCPNFGTKKEDRREPDDVWTEIKERLDLLADTSGGTVGWSLEPALAKRKPLSLEGAATGDLAARPWPADRSLGSPWQVSSYTAMVAGRTFDAGEPQRPDELRATTDEAGEHRDDTGAQVELGEPEAVPPGLDVAIATTALRGGTGVGTWAHAVLENLDFQQARAHDGRNLGALVADLGLRHGIRSPGQHQLLVGAIPAVLDTPLGGGATGLPEGFSLRHLPRVDRLDELGFDLRLGAGNRWRHRDGDVRLNHEGARIALSSRLGESGWGGDEWLRAILDRSDREGNGVLPNIAGILTGFIDLTFRVEVPGEGGGTRHRYFVSDYKTNRIAPVNQRRDSRLLHYTHPWMAWEMAHHGYHLQALLYTVALHRMLSRRLPGYSYEKHVGGHLYLFLRGMQGPAAGRYDACTLGVYFDRWPAEVVLGLDAALLGAPTDEIQAIVEDPSVAGGAP